MTKHKKPSKHSKSLTGGAWYEPTTWFGSSDPYAPKKSWFSDTTGSVSEGASNLVNKTENLLGSTTSGIKNGLGSAWSSATNLMSPTTASSSISPITTNQPVIPIGGTHIKRIRRTMAKSKKMKGGKGGLGLTYYATPVNTINVAEPTYWMTYNNNNNNNTSPYTIKGGSKKRRGQKKTRRHKKH